MRADRVIRALLLLQSRGSMTAAQLAEELETSVATARRDLEALLAAGFPLYSQPGRGGGWRILGDARLDLTGLTGPEAAALFVRLSQSARSGTEVSAEQKLLQALPAPTREKAERIRDATKSGPAWGAVDIEEPAEVQTLKQAIAEQRIVRFEYGQGRDEREVFPLVVGNRGDRWYLIAVKQATARTAEGEPTATADPRTYRVDRMTNLAMTMHAGAAPSGFDADRAWDELDQQVQSLRGAVTAAVEVETRFAAAFLGHFGTHARLVADEGSTTVVDVTAHTVQGLAEQLAGWVHVSMVREPAAVCRELAAIGAALASRYPVSTE